VVVLPIELWEDVSGGGSLVGLFYPAMLKKRSEEQD